MNKDPIEHCRLLSASTRVAYEGIGSVFCPILREEVAFNAKGLHHLFYKSDGTPRKVSEIIYKLTLFPLAIPVIKNATSIAEERNIQIKKSRRKSAALKNAKSYALVAKVGRKNPVPVRVILLRVGNGKLVFRSIMKD